MTPAEIAAIAQMIAVLGPALTQLIAMIAAAIAAGNQPKAAALQAFHDSLVTGFVNAMLVK